MSEEKLRKSTGDCAEEILNNHFKYEKSELSIPPELAKHQSSPVRLLEVLTKNQECIILDRLASAHSIFLKAKYDLYQKRAEFYTNKENWDKCKEESGKATDSVFREYARKHLAELMHARELAEFEYEQCKRVFESL